MQFVFFHLHVTLNLRCPSQTVIVSQSNCKLNNYTVLRKTIRKEQFLFIIKNFTTNMIYISIVLVGETTSLPKVRIQLDFEHKTNHTKSL